MDVCEYCVKSSEASKQYTVVNLGQITKEENCGNLSTQ